MCVAMAESASPTRASAGKSVLLSFSPSESRSLRPSLLSETRQFSLAVSVRSDRTLMSQLQRSCRLLFLGYAYRIVET